MGISNLVPIAHERRPWNAGSLVGAKRPLKPCDVRAIRFFLTSENARSGAFRPSDWQQIKGVRCHKTKDS
jgi:hypothetical protein